MCTFCIICLRYSCGILTRYFIQKVLKILLLSSIPSLISTVHQEPLHEEFPLLKAALERNQLMQVRTTDVLLFFADETFFETGDIHSMALLSTVRTVVL